ncbi:MAG TPA: VWA domain-containing protein [Pyrinomonadaceae bacterium]
MRFSIGRVGVAACLILALALAGWAQSGRSSQRGAAAEKPNAQKQPAEKKASPKASPTPEAEAETSAEDGAMEEEEDASEVVKVETDLVAVPVVASDRNDRYVPDMRREEFELYEDGAKQEIVFFATTSAPFHVVLMLDTSASTQEKLGQIQQAAISFVEQLQPEDRIKVVSFDDKVRSLSDFTNDRATLGAAIRRTFPGRGTKLYDAMQLALRSLVRVEGRKAVVIFTDGVDWHSERVRYNDNVREIEESGVIVYPIRFDTREETERLAREQAREGQRVNLGTVFGGGSTRTTTPTTVPGGEGLPLPEDAGAQRRSGGSAPRGTTPTTVPGGQIPYPGGGGGGGLGLPFPPIVVSRPQGGTTNPQPRGGTSTPGQWPDDPNSTRGADTRYPGQSRSDDPASISRASADDESISRMLDLAYKTADGYLKEIAAQSGGRLHRADTLASLPVAFAQIASELRTQYSLGYYPANRTRDGRYRKIQVRTARKGVVLRSRPGYRARR